MMPSLTGRAASILLVAAGFVVGGSSVGVAELAGAPKAATSHVVNPHSPTALNSSRFQRFALKTLYAGPNQIVAGPGGYLWFTERNTVGKIGRISLTGDITEIPLPGHYTTVEAMLIGPDGNLWFSGYGHQIGRMTPDGSITWFSGKSSGYVGSLTLGPDHNLWYAAGNVDGSGLIGRMTPQGVVTEFPLSNQFGGAGQLIAGPDGRLWFTTATAIGAMTPTGKVTMYRLPVRNGDGRPTALTVGPDGNLWFIEWSDPRVTPNRICRMSPSGQLAEFGVPTDHAGLGAITRGPDGYLWFTEGFSPSKLGRITSVGSVHEFPLPDSFGKPWAIVTGPDGNLWMTAPTDAENGAIFRVNLH